MWQRRLGFIWIRCLWHVSGQIIYYLYLFGSIRLYIRTTFPEPVASGSALATLVERLPTSALQQLRKQSTATNESDVSAVTESKWNRLISESKSWLNHYNMFAILPLPQSSKSPRIECWNCSDCIDWIWFFDWRSNCDRWTQLNIAILSSPKIELPQYPCWLLAPMLIIKSIGFSSKCRSELVVVWVPVLRPALRRHWTRCKTTYTT